MSEEHRLKLREAWAAWKTGVDLNTLAIKDMTAESSKIELRRKEFDQYMRDAIGNATQALEFLRQLTICSRTSLRENLLIFIEAADMMLPAGDGDVARMNDMQVRRVAIMTDWFSDPLFFSGRDSVCLVAESRSLIHPRVSRLPQVISVDIPSPDLATRKHFIQWHRNQPSTNAIPVSDSAGEVTGSGNGPTEVDSLGEATAGLSIHALRQLMLASTYFRRPVSRDDVVRQVEQFIQSQLGEDVVEFKKPKHTLKDIVGFTNLKKFLEEYMMPRLKLPDDRALPGLRLPGRLAAERHLSLKRSLRNWICRFSFSRASVVSGSDRRT